MDKRTLILLYLFLLLASPPRYYPILPTLPVYPNNKDEVEIVRDFVNSRDKFFVGLFELTDPGVSSAFVEHVPESLSELSAVITQPHLVYFVKFIKGAINRPRPKQIDPSLHTLSSTTAATPAYPSGHAFQAYYLANILSKRYPEKAELFDVIADNCALCRVYAGLHFPSDNEFSKRLVGLFF